MFTHRDGSDALIVCTGGIYAEVHEASNVLARSGTPVDSYLLRFIKPRRTRRSFSPLSLPIVAS